MVGFVLLPVAPARIVLLLLTFVPTALYVVKPPQTKDQARQSFRTQQAESDCFFQLSPRIQWYFN